MMLLGHGARLVMLGAIAWLLNDIHQRRVSRVESFDLPHVSLDLVRRHLPDAAGIGGPSSAVGEGLEVLNAAGDRVGTILRTSPAGDRSIGFSGPTDMLVVCDADLRVAGMEILSSRDTRDHVRVVERDKRFLESLAGKPLADLATLESRSVDAVAGSTLTSMAIVDAIVLRLGGRAETSRFVKAPTLADVQLVFPDAGGIEPEHGDPSVLHVMSAPPQKNLGWCLRTSPAADRVIGYQGPTDALVGFDNANRVVGIAVLASFDNEPYVGYVRDDEAFRGLLRGMAMEELAGIDPAAAGVEGVSGATMTSEAVAAGIVQAARAYKNRVPPIEGELVAIRAWVMAIEPPQWGALAVIAVGVAVAFTRARGMWLGRVILPMVVLAYLGFGAGAVLSMAQFAGWAQSGVPTGAAVLTVLALVALVLPATTKRNVYCAHLCAHGAAQQLILRIAKPKGRVSPRVRGWLSSLPWALLVFAIIATVVPLPVALVDLEPFDAYVPLVAGVPALVIFVVSLLASARHPMAYCRYGCPTGALIDAVRLNRASSSLTWRDAALSGCLAVALAVWWFQ